MTPITDEQAREALKELAVLSFGYTAVETLRAYIDQRAAQQEPALLASATAHRACCSEEHDPQNGKLHGCCVVCGVPWPCDTARAFLDASQPATPDVVRPVQIFPIITGAYMGDMKKVVAYARGLADSWDASGDDFAARQMRELCDKIEAGEKLQVITAMKEQPTHD